ncbi:phage-associated DNA helicase [alpha proteobacterium U9-1i]|nr:phage-associated DNA helicase [alpha proteobacterium U9-1i]
MTVPSLPTFATAEEMATQVRKADYLIGSVLERGVFAMLFGEPGTGKSFLALDWSCSIASGRDWLGRPTQQGTVIYIAGEGLAGLGRRVKAWAQHHSVPVGHIRLYVSKYGENFLDAEEMEALRETMRQAPRPILLVVVDTMARATPNMNEDRANEVGVFVAACDELRDEFGCAVLVIHHSPHKDKGRAKGSIALKGAVDFEAGLKHTSKPGVIRFACSKMKDGEPFAPMHLRLESVEMSAGGATVSSAVLTECDAPAETARQERAFKPTANDKLLMLALGLERQAETAVRAAFMAGHPTGQGDAAKNYLRARNRALRRGWFVVQGDALLPATEAIMRDRE